MKKSNKLPLLIALVGASCSIQLYPDQQIQARIRDLMKKNEEKAKTAYKTTSSLEKFLTELKNDLRTILKDAPNTAQYKSLKKAVENFNPKALAANISHFKTILDNVDKDIREAILKILPYQATLFLKF